MPPRALLGRGVTTPTLEVLGDPGSLACVFLFHFTLSLVSSVIRSASLLLFRKGEEGMSCCSSLDFSGKVPGVRQEPQCCQPCVGGKCHRMVLQCQNRKGGLGRWDSQAQRCRPEAHRHSKALRDLAPASSHSLPISSKPGLSF